MLRHTTSRLYNGLTHRGDCQSSAEVVQDVAFCGLACGLEFSAEALSSGASPVVRLAGLCVFYPRYIGLAGRV